MNADYKNVSSFYGEKEILDLASYCTLFLDILYLLKPSSERLFRLSDCRQRRKKISNGAFADFLSAHKKKY
jgi:hypothetical protein